MAIEEAKFIDHSAHETRRGWETQFIAMADNGDDRLLDEPTPTQWDETEWMW